MFVLGYFFQAVANVLYYALTLYMWIVIARAVLSWVSPDPYNPVVRIIYSMTDPLFYQIRKRIPINLGMIDISPVIVLLFIFFIKIFVVRSLFHIAATLIRQ